MTDKWDRAIDKTALPSTTADECAVAMAQLKDALAAVGYVRKHLGSHGLKIADRVSDDVCTLYGYFAFREAMGCKTGEKL